MKKIMDAFIENDADVKIIEKENEGKVLFNLRILNDLAVCEKFVNGELYRQYKMAPKLKCSLFDS